MSRNVINRISVLPHLPNTGAALDLLERLARAVEPLMVSNGLFIDHLTEFLPRQELLGMNQGRGVKVSIRLRRDDDRMIEQFLSDEELLGTLLHELAHNRFHDHDEHFEKYLDGLKSQYYLLVSRQIGDHQPPRPTQGGRSRDPPRGGGSAQPSAAPRRRPGYGGGSNSAAINTVPQGATVPQEPVDRGGGGSFVGGGRRLGGNIRVPADSEEVLRHARLHRFERRR
jgi:hypothetical protein